TLQCVQWIFQQGCPLVILACNTASAKALRTIQQNDLQKIAPGKRVLGVIRPTTEIIGNYTQTKCLGILATAGTVQSQSYIIEIEKFFPDVKVVQEACPIWVPLIENNEHENKGADFFVKKYLHQLLQKEEKIDTILLACTHYPLLLKKITEYTPLDIKIVTQGEIVANSLANYLQRHTEIEMLLTKNHTRKFFTTDSTEDFDNHAAMFYGTNIESKHLDLA
ncbi:MAG TPA: aspartate/glutamate racemase family protein, partial [Chitinophagaceae bacterium]|nr:aspartate/glutamate racemase family protein [Chitinophagaceae bacterium]